MIRKLVLVGCLGVCAFLTPIQSAIWNGSDMASWLMWLGQNFSGLEFKTASKDLIDLPPSYYQYGHFFVLVYVGILYLWLADTMLRSKASGKVAILGLGIALLADVHSYWISQSYAAFKHEVFLFGEVPGILIALLALTVYWFQYFKPGFIKWFGLVILPLAFLITAIVRYMPHGPLLALILAYVPIEFCGDHES